MTLDTKRRRVSFRDEAPQGVDQKGHQPPDPEVSSKGKRRSMTAAYKNRILRLAEAKRMMRGQVLERAFTAHPGRFKGKMPQPPVLPTEAWINKPSQTLPEIQ